MTWAPDRPYNDLPPLPPAADVETKPVLRRCATARAALGELKHAVDLIPNQGILLNTLPLLEAQASSEIENVLTTADALFRHLEAERDVDPATREALRYREALMDGYRALADRPLGTRTAEAICTRIKGVDMRVRVVPGTTIANAATAETIYTPPDGESRLRDLLANWERFLHEPSELDPLIRMAIAHYQFEAIHPFTDGNGRTGRILNSLYLVQQGLIALPVLYMSRYIIANKRDYYRMLAAVTRDDDWEPWIVYMLSVITDTAQWTTAKISAIRSLANQTNEHVRRHLPKIHSRELIDVLFEQPYCRIGNVTDAGIVRRQAASRYLQQLASIGVLEAHRIGRELLFTHPRLLHLLTTDANDFAPFEPTAP